MSKHPAWSIAGACAVIVLAGWMIARTHARREIVPQLLQTSPITYSNYVNVRFAYSICYPQKLLAPQGESPDGDGQKFASSDGQVTATVYGTNNVPAQSLEQVLSQDAEGVALSKQTMTADRFTFSGKKSNNTVVVEDTLFRDQQFKTLNLEFPAALTETYAPVAERMIACFSNTTPTQYSH
jgi:hypothetical protein